ncbi:MAG: hypothetical protein QOE14_2479, partial [Humisphaera sp.]|nr:hypothetical protein [Humisphaera sp.]
MFSEPPAHAAYIWSRTSLVLQVQQVLHAARAWQGVVMERDHGGLRLVVGDETLGRLRWNGRLEVPFPAELRERLIGDGMAARDPEY